MQNFQIGKMNIDTNGDHWHSFNHMSFRKGDICSTLTHHCKIISTRKSRFKVLVIWSTKSRSNLIGTKRLLDFHFHTSTHLRHVRTGIDQSINLVNPHWGIYYCTNHHQDPHTHWRIYHFTNQPPRSIHIEAIMVDPPQATRELFLWRPPLDARAQDCRTTVDEIWGGWRIFRRRCINIARIANAVQCHN